jgi:heme exporter protein B
VSETVAVFVREWTTEWRTRVALSSTALFAVGALTLIGLALRGGQAVVSPNITAGLLWVLLLFTAATGLGRAFVQEEERGTALALRLCARGSVVWTGKFLANLALILGIAAFSAPALLTMLAIPVANVLLLSSVLVLGSVGIAGVFTMTSALVAQASAKGGLLAALSFPLLVPLLVASVHGTEAALGVGAKPGEMVSLAVGLPDIQVLLSYAVVTVTASLLLFDFLWND